MCDHLLSADLKVGDELRLRHYVLLSNDAVGRNFYSWLCTLVFDGVFAHTASTCGRACPRVTSFG